MKKLIDDPRAVVADLVAGLVATRPDLRQVPGHHVVVRADADFLARRDERVALISGGGSGHEPAHAGYVGRGMLSAAVLGDVFTSPSPDAVLAAIEATAGRAGAVLLVKNYTGDRLNFGLAAELARQVGIAVEVVVVADDVALLELDHAGETAGPRGLAGTVLVHKVAGAAAEAGLSLAEVAAEARAAADAVATMGVALAPCTVPAAGRPGFDLGPDEVELGLGIHGEPGVRRIPIEPADALVGRLLDSILRRLSGTTERLALMVNGLGGTPPIELAIVARDALAQLGKRGHAVERTYVGTFLSALEMSGVSLSLLRVDDDRLARLDAATDAPAWPNAPARSAVTPATEAEPEAEPTPLPGPPTTEAGRRLAAALERAARVLIEQADHLTALDQMVGDGDLGISLRRGAEAVQAALPSWPVDDPGATLFALGRLLQRVLGGTSGPLYAILAVRAAAVLRDAPTAWPEALAAGVAGVTDLGGAHAGDRTMLDALIPAAQALTGGRPLGAAVEAAEAGARATAEMTPRKGRSSYLGGRAVGHPDPGAVAVALWLRAVADGL